jgi:hypothetical protein
VRLLLAGERPADTEGPLSRRSRHLSQAGGCSREKLTTRRRGGKREGEEEEEGEEEDEAARPHLVQTTGSPLPCHLLSSSQFHLPSVLPSAPSSTISLSPTQTPRIPNALQRSHVKRYSHPVCGIVDCSMKVVPERDSLSKGHCSSVVWQSVKGQALGFGMLSVNGEVSFAFLALHEGAWSKQSSSIISTCHQKRKSRIRSSFTKGA